MSWVEKHKSRHRKCDNKKKLEFGQDLRTQNRKLNKIMDEWDPKYLKRSYGARTLGWNKEMRRLVTMLCSHIIYLVCKRKSN